VARECGLTVEELRQRYPKLRAEWDGARKKQVLLKATVG
jgi:molybdopterin converting factor small subunit